MATWLTEVELSGHGVTLEPLRTEHAEELRVAVLDGELWKLWFTLVPRVEEMGSYIASALQTQVEGSAVPFLIRTALDGKAVGTTRFCNIDHAHQRAEIGYTWLAKSIQRTSANSACKLLLLQHRFEDRAAIAVEFRTHWHNAASRQVILRLGAKQDGVLRQHRRESFGGFRDTVVYSILDNEWPPVKLGLTACLTRS